METGSDLTVNIKYINGVFLGGIWSNSVIGQRFRDKSIPLWIDLFKHFQCHI